MMVFKTVLHCIVSPNLVRLKYDPIMERCLSGFSPRCLRTFQQESLLERRRDEIRERLDLFEASGLVQVFELAFRFRDEVADRKKVVNLWLVVGVVGASRPSVAVGRCLPCDYEMRRRQTVA